GRHANVHPPACDAPRHRADGRHLSTDGLGEGHRSFRRGNGRRASSRGRTAGIDMGWEGLFVLCVVLIITLLLSGMWIPFAIGITGFILLYAKSGITGLNALGLTVWGGTNSFILTSLPLFVFMAEILIVSGVGHKFYEGLSRI